MKNGLLAIAMVPVLALAAGCTFAPLRSVEFFPEERVAQILDEAPCKIVQKSDSTTLFFGIGGAPVVRKAIAKLPPGVRNVETAERITQFALLPFIAVHKVTATGCVSAFDQEAGRSRERIEIAALPPKPFESDPVFASWKDIKDNTGIQGACFKGRKSWKEFVHRFRCKQGNRRYERSACLELLTPCEEPSQ